MQEARSTVNKVAESRLLGDSCSGPGATLKFHATELRIGLTVLSESADPCPQL